MMMMMMMMMNIQFDFQTELMQFCETDVRFLKQDCLMLFSKPETL